MFTDVGVSSLAQFRTGYASLMHPDARHLISGFTLGNTADSFKRGLKHNDGAHDTPKLVTILEKT